jgi:hydrogenase assembly chaperone HypC/HupF
MCLGEPARIRTIDGANATVETIDRVLDVSLMVLAAQHRYLKPGDWVVVSIGLAIDTMEPDDAQELMERLAELHRLEPTIVVSSETTS